MAPCIASIPSLPHVILKPRPSPASASNRYQAVFPPPTNRPGNEATSERDREALCLEGLGQRRVKLKVWRRTERGLQVEEKESVVFSNIEVRVEPSGLGDVEVTEYIARMRSGPFAFERFFRHKLFFKC